MRKRNAIVLCALVALAFVSGCGGAKQESLTVSGGEPITYQCENGDQVVARYYSLSDDSLHFAKVLLPDGTEYTLPNVYSGSGARYTDDFKLVWWTKGETALAEERQETGEWQPLYQECQQIAETQ